MTIDGLTHEQVEMLDKLWSLDTIEEVLQFRSTLPLFRRQQIDTLMEMLQQEACEEVLQSMEHYPMVENLLARLKNR